MNYTYMVRCKDGTLYTGWTNDLKKRVQVHNTGKGAKYTKSRRPVKLVYYEIFETKEEAMRREYAIKRMSKCKKEKLIRESMKVNFHTEFVGQMCVQARPLDPCVTNLMYDFPKIFLLFCVGCSIMTVYVELR